MNTMSAVASAFLARHGLDGLWTRIIEATAEVMAARERMAALCEDEADLIDGLARLEILLEIAELSGFWRAALWRQCPPPDADAWSYPGLTLARLIVAANCWLRRLRPVEDLVAAVANAWAAMDRVTLPWREQVDQAKARLIAEMPSLAEADGV